MRKQRAVRKDQEAVSPVIATILMVAITVVLAAVLYVMVSGLVTGPSSNPQTIGTRVLKSSDGTKWVIEFVDTPASMKNSTVSLIVFNSDGSIQLAKTTLDALRTKTSGAQYIPSTTGDTIAPGDRVLLDLGTGTDQYSAGDSFQLVNDDGILASGTLQ